MQTLKLELLLHLPHIAEEASKRRGRKPKEIDIEQVRQMREEGMALHLISAALGVDYKRLVDLVSAEPSLKRRLGSVDTAEVLRLHAEGLTQTQIAAELGCCAISVYRRIKQARQEDEATEQQRRGDQGQRDARSRCGLEEDRRRAPREPRPSALDVWRALNFILTDPL
jgi:DNA invertase Pin-like site-specific DNA recombinase